MWKALRQQWHVKEHKAIRVGWIVKKKHSKTSVCHPLFVESCMQLSCQTSLWHFLPHLLNYDSHLCNPHGGSKTHYSGVDNKERTPFCLQGHCLHLVAVCVSSVYYIGTFCHTAVWPALTNTLWWVFRSTTSCGQLRATQCTRQALKCTQLLFKSF